MKVFSPGGGSRDRACSSIGGVSRAVRSALRRGIQWRPPARGILVIAVAVSTLGAALMIDPAGVLVEGSAVQPKCVVVDRSAALGAAAGSHRAPAGMPLLAVIGASFAAGVGSDGPHEGWPYQVGRIEGWRVVVSADPGAGFVNPGIGHHGPFSRLAGRLGLARLNPSIVIVQGGYNDVGRPPAAVAAQVTALVDTIRRSAPRARLGLISVFSLRAGPTRTAVALDHTIIGAARRADPSVVVFDPLAEHWVFPRIADDLHPSPAGHVWIATRIAQGLRTSTVRSTTQAAAGHTGVQS